MKRCRCSAVRWLLPKFWPDVWDVWQADVVVPVNKHGFEPFHAMYRRMECLPAVRRALDRGEKRAQSFFGDDSVVVHEFPQSKVLEAEPMGGCFINANTPDELHALEDMVMEG